MAAINLMLSEPPKPIFPILRATGFGDSYGVSSTTGTLSGLIPSGGIGDVLIIWYAISGSSVITETSGGGWTKHSQISQSTNNTGALFYKIATAENSLDGKDTFIASHGSARNAGIIYRISNTSGTVDASSAVSGATTSWNPPSVTSSWYTATRKYFAIVFAFSGTSLTYVPPSDYTNGISVKAVPEDATGPHLYSAYRNVETITEDPAASTQPASANYGMYTVLVHPLAYGEVAPA